METTKKAESPAVLDFRFPNLISTTKGASNGGRRRSCARNVEAHDRGQRCFERTSANASIASTTTDGSVGFCRTRSTAKRTLSSAASRARDRDWIKTSSRSNFWVINSIGSLIQVTSVAVGMVWAHAASWVSWGSGPKTSGRSLSREIPVAASIAPHFLGGTPRLRQFVMTWGFFSAIFSASADGPPAIPIASSKAFSGDSSVSEAEFMPY